MPIPHGDLSHVESSYGAEGPVILFCQPAFGFFNPWLERTLLGRVFPDDFLPGINRCLVFALDEFNHPLIIINTNVAFACAVQFHSLLATWTHLNNLLYLQRSK